MAAKPSTASSRICARSLAGSARHAGQPEAHHLVQHAGAFDGERHRGQSIRFDGFWTHILSIIRYAPASCAVSAGAEIAQHRGPARIAARGGVGVLFQRERDVHARAGRELGHAAAKFQAFSTSVRPFWRTVTLRCFSFMTTGGPATSTSSAANSGGGLPWPNGASAKISSTALLVDLAQLQHGVDLQRGAENLPARRRAAAKALKRWRNSSTRDGFQRDAGGVLVAAESHEQVGHGFQRFQQMERRDAAARALRQAIVRIAAEHEHRPVQALHQAAGHDAQHAAMPVLGVVDQRAAAADPPRCCSQAARGSRLPPAGARRSDRASCCGQVAGARRVAGEEQLDHRAGGVHASGGIDARRDLEAPPGVRWALRRP